LEAAHYKNGQTIKINKKNTFTEFGTATPMKLQRTMDRKSKYNEQFGTNNTTFYFKP
jgi:hypothetical protein